MFGQIVQGSSSLQSYGLPLSIAIAPKMADPVALQFVLEPTGPNGYANSAALMLRRHSFHGEHTVVKCEFYRDLVTARKACRLCHGLRNPAEVDDGCLDSDHVGPWSRWQGNLEAPLLVVGQDWGDERYLRKYGGVEGPGNRTNRTLVKLFGTIGIDIGEPGDLRGEDVVFFTNAILCLKEGGLQGRSGGVVP
ncbi:MAG: hypothetical protein IPH86_12830 [bacterium]|nr:hypothetical protein [bacterium]